MYGLKGMLRAWGPGLVVVAGDFTVSATPAITSIRPSRPGFTLNRFAAGVYGITLAQAFASVVEAVVKTGPDTGITGSLPTANPVAEMISQGFLSSNTGGTAFAADATGTKLLITMTSAGSLAELPSNYRCSFAIVLAESQVNR
ncbi:MAG TPA: hypothetical protein VGG39_23380 [Polyangiaceae bacterium]